jgi:hypothetical protein
VASGDDCNANHCCCKSNLIRRPCRWILLPIT